MDDLRKRLELTPEQPPEVADEVEAALAAADRGPDPWWRAGLEEQLGQ